MIARRKSRFERLLSFNQHRRRFGAKQLDVDADIDVMKARILDEGTAVQTRGSERSLDIHISQLRREFSGQSELLWHHAKLIVLIRREYRTDQTFARFRNLWEIEGEFLCRELNVRWLISAADTFADLDSDPQVRAVAMLVTLLGNTVKLYESERYLCDSKDREAKLELVEQVQSELVPLFSGTSCFTVGTDDTLRNMYWRLDQFVAIQPVGTILRSVWNKLQVEDTAFARMRKMHRRDRTGWWDDLIQS